MSTNGRLHRFVVSVAALMLLVQLVALYQGLPGALRGKANFRCLYTAGFMVRTGHRHEIYDNQSTQSFQQQLVSREDGAVAFDRPAYEALLFAPLSILGYRAAYVSFFILNLGFLAFAIRWLRPYLDKFEKVWRWGPVAVFVCFFPVGMSLIQGEDSIVLLTFLVASAVCFYRGWDFSAGILLGLTLFNFQYSLPIALLFLLWRRWRILAGFSISAAACVLVSVWITGLQGLKTYAQLLRMWNSQSLPDGWGSRRFSLFRNNTQFALPDPCHGSGPHVFAHSDVDCSQSFDRADPLGRNQASQLCPGNDGCCARQLSRIHERCGRARCPDRDGA